MEPSVEPAREPPSDASPSARLSVILARQSDVAVVFRRGPTRLTQLIRWHRSDDRFFPGQWFRGRIYEQRCDLSPSGEKLIYFAASYRQPLYAWTAISRPPFLTALALWPKGDCWGGGGQFEKESRVQLNHPPPDGSLADGFTLPKGMTLLPFGPHSGGGEDDPILRSRLIRDGWTLIEPGQVHRHGLRAAVRFILDPAETWSKPHPAVPTLELRTAITGYGRRGGAWRIMQAAVQRRGEPALSLGELDWADWDRNGDLLSARDGQLFRTCVHEGKLTDPVCLLDTRAMRYRECPPSDEARTWHLPLALD